MSKRLILHLGTQKTGSKAIQKFLAEHRGILRDNDTEIFKSGYNGLWHQDFYLNFVPSYLDCLHTSLSYHNQIISWENAYAYPDLIFNKIATDNTAFVLFLRNPSEWMNSFLNQMVKAHRITIYEISDFLSGKRRFFPLKNLVEFGKRCRAYQYIDAYILGYEKGKDVIGQFLETIGIEYSFNSGEVERKQRNMALNAYGLRLFYELKKRMVGCQKEELADIITKMIEFCIGQRLDIYSKVNCEPVLLDTESVKYIDDVYRPEIESLFNHVFPQSEILNHEIINFEQGYLDPLVSEVVKDFMAKYQLNCNP